VILIKFNGHFQNCDIDQVFDEMIRFDEKVSSWVRHMHHTATPALVAFDAPVARAIEPL